MATLLKIAVLLYPQVCPTDYQGPIDIFSFASPESIDAHTWDSSHALTADFLAVTMKPVFGSSGPGFTPTRTYDSVGPDEQYDIILVPGGPGSRPEVAPEIAASIKVVIEFIQRQAPNATYVLSTCTGAELLARAGVLQSKSATTNKAQFKRIKGTYVGIKWVSHARWVVDGKTWTSSGVTAGMDMACAFLEFLIGDNIATQIRGIVELSRHDQWDDEFADYWNVDG